MKKVCGVFLSALLLTGAVAGCGAQTKGSQASASFDPSKEITAVDRKSVV